MKSLPFILLIAFLISLLSGCSNSSEEDFSVDCSQSDLNLQVVDHSKPDCETKGSITVSGSGGTKPYVFRIDGANLQSSTVFNDLSASTYSITIEDRDGCTSQTQFNLQAGPNGVTINVGSKTSSDCFEATGSIQVSASGGDGDFMYSLDGGTTQQSNVFNLVSSGNHTITAIDGTGCEASISTFVESTVSLSANIIPIIDTNCAISGCHNGTQFPRLTSTNDIIQQASRIKAETQARTMPRDGSLTQEEIDLIACWVDDGAKDN